MRKSCLFPLSLIVATLSGCGNSSSGAGTSTDAGSATRLNHSVQAEPFALVISQGDAEILSSVAGISPLDPASLAHLANIDELINPSTLTELNGIADLSARYGSLGFALDLRAEAQLPLIAYGAFLAVPIRWFHATSAEKVGEGRYRVATDDPLGRTFDLTVQPLDGGRLAVEAALSDMTGVTALGWSFKTSEGERFLGFGERSDAVDHTGRFVENWAEEGPFSAGFLRPATEPLFGEDWQTPYPIPGTNFPMPWFVSSKGYGFLLDDFSYSAFRMQRANEWNVETRGDRIRFVVFAGPRPADVVSRFAAHNGRQPAPAEWFFGPWYQPLGTGEFRRQLITQWRAWDIPVTVSQTYAHYLPCAAQFGRRDALREETAYYHANGYRVTTYVNSFVCESHPEGAYDEGDGNGYFIKTLLGNTYPIPYVAFLDSSSAVIDFTHPEAGSWWQGLITQALEDGYDGWMEDFGEYVPPDSVTHDGRRGLQYHNQYCTDYHRQSHELTWPRYGSDFAQFIRCGNIGTAPYARIVWGGDPTEDESLADGLGAAIHQGISMGLSGIAYWGSDIGGFHSLFTADRTSADTLMRWIEFGTFSGIMRMQEDGYERPGQGERVHIWDDAIRPHWRKYTKLRTQLFPYVWEAAQEYQRSGMPIMRHLSLAAPDDPQSFGAYSQDQYFFGPDMLVAPVVPQGVTSRELYLPEGRWCNFWQHVAYDETSGEFSRKAGPGATAGAQIVTVDAPLGEIPLFVRAGASIPMLPAETDTLTDIGSAPGLVELADVRNRQRTLAFGENCQ